MSKRTSFTIISPLPASVSREIVMEMLHSYTDMIDLNPLVEERRPIKPPPNATAEEYNCLWYSLTDRVQYLPGGIIRAKVSYNVCFHDLANGLQAHYYAPFGMNVKNKWTLCGSLPGETAAPPEIGVGAPLSGLYLREDIKMTCNFMATAYMKKVLKKAHATLISQLLARAQFLDVRSDNLSLDHKYNDYQQDFEPIEFGRDGQNTPDVVKYDHCPSIKSMRSPQFAYEEFPRPSSAHCGYQPKSHFYSLSLSTSSLLQKDNNVQHIRASSSCSPVVPLSPWQSLNSPLRSPSVANIDSSPQDACFELDAQEPTLPTKTSEYMPHEMGSESEIRKLSVSEKKKPHFPQRPCLVVAPVELEGSFPSYYDTPQTS